MTLCIYFTLNIKICQVMKRSWYTNIDKIIILRYDLVLKLNNHEPCFRSIFEPRSKYGLPIFICKWHKSSSHAERDLGLGQRQNTFRVFNSEGARHGKV